VARGVADKYALALATIAVEGDARGPALVSEPAACAELVVPIGVLEAAIEAGCRASIWGDVLASNAALAAVEQRASRALAAEREISSDVIEPLLEAPLEGARPEDVLAVLMLANRQSTP